MLPLSRLAAIAAGKLIVKGTTKAAAKAAIKEVGKATEKTATRKLGSSAAAKAAPKKPTLSKSSGPRSEASRNNQYNERQVRKYDDRDGGGPSKAEKIQEERTQKALDSAKARKSKTRTTPTPAKKAGDKSHEVAKGKKK